MMLKKLGLLVCLVACQSVGSGRPVALSDALSLLEGDAWTGTLTYLNYGEPVKDYTIPATLSVTQTADGFVFAYGYPDEPQENSKGIVTIGADDKTLDGNAVQVHEYGADGMHRIVTKGPCEDMGQAAMCEKTWTISETRFSMRKMVAPDDGRAPFRRNEYTFSR